MITCQECGMACEPAEYHPFAACLMFKACNDGAMVRANMDAVRAPLLAEAEALRKAAQAVVDRWDSPQWKWAEQGPTADVINELRAALRAKEEHHG